MVSSFPGGSDGKESASNAGHLGLIPGFGRSPGGRAWQPTPVFLPGETPWTEEPGGLHSMGSQRVGHYSATKHSTYKYNIKNFDLWDHTCILIIMLHLYFEKLCI